MFWKAFAMAFFVTLQPVDASTKANSELEMCQSVQLDWVKKHSKSLHPVDVVNATLPTGAFPNIFRSLSSEWVLRNLETGLANYLEYICGANGKEGQSGCKLLQMLRYNKRIEGRLLESMLNAEAGSSQLFGLLAGQGTAEIDPLSSEEIEQYMVNKFEISQKANPFAKLLQGSGAHPCSEQEVMLPVYLIASQYETGSALGLLTAFKYIDFDKTPIVIRSQLQLIQENIHRTLQEQHSEIYPLLLMLKGDLDFPVSEGLLNSTQKVELYKSALATSYSAVQRTKIRSLLALNRSSNGIPDSDIDLAASKASIALGIMWELMESTSSADAELSAKNPPKQELIAGKQDLENISNKVNAEIVGLIQSLKAVFSERDLL